MVVDPMGEIQTAEPGKDSILTVTIKRSLLEEGREKLPFWKDADSFTIH
jgi:predicted amidohydrolase